MKGRGIPTLRISLVTLAALLAIAGGLHLSSHQSEAVGGARISFPSSDCSESSAELTFKWTPLAGATEQWLDVSLNDNRFLFGTYTGIKLEPGQNTLTMQALDADAPHYWRINSRTADGWEESQIGQFVPCGGPQLLWGPVICQSTTLAAVDFNWAPRSDVLGYQYLELSSTTNFGSNVTRIGPLAAFADGFRRGGFAIGERTYFRVVSEGFDDSVIATPIASFVPECTAEPVNSFLYPSNDRLVSADLGFDAPVNVRDVGYNGFLGNPAGAFDTVRYNFVALPQLHGYPGDGGVTMVGGHVDYYEVGLAIFASLRSAQPGDVIEYHRSDGQAVRYQVDWIRDVNFDQVLNSYLISDGRDELILVTCNGTFDQSEGRYDLRRLVHAVRIN